MPKFTSAAAVEQICLTCRLADWPRAQNRVLINSLFSGEPPETAEEQDINDHGTNYNDLSATKINHDARSQFDNAFLAPDPLFTINLDYGPAYKRVEWSGRITKEINKQVLASPEYLDLRQAVFAGVVLHGVGPTMWEDKESWCPTELGIEDVLLPSNTLRSMKNLPFFAIWRSYSANQFWKMTHGPRVDSGWNMKLVDKCFNWIDSQMAQLVGQNYPHVQFPEKIQRRQVQDSGLYASDAVPTIDVFDFYYWNDDKKVSGWNRKMILDAWSSPGTGGVGGFEKNIPARRFKHGDGDFLFDSGDRKYADKLSQIVHFQFGDTSPLSPFYYHAVRSLGFLLYSVCSLQNLLKCRFNDAVFEHMLQYFRVNNPADTDRLSKINLKDKGILPEGLNFVPLAERWEIDANVPLQAMQVNRQAMADVSSAFTQDLDIGERRDVEETATRTMAKVNSAAALVGSMLNRAYARERFRYLEMCRRFCILDSKDPDVKKFRVQCLKNGVPEEALDVERWNVQPTRVTGGGNKLLQVAIADKMQAIRPQLDPDAQKEVDRIYIAANTNDWNLAKQLVPEVKHVSNSMVQASANVGTLMTGVPVPLQQGINHTEYVETMLTAMAMIIKRIEESGGMATQAEILGLSTMASHIQQHIQIIAQDPSEKSRTKQYSDFLGGLMNSVKGFAQRLQEQMQAQNGQGNGPDLETMQKVQSAQMLTQAKVQNTRESHADRTAQRRLTFEQQTRQKEIEHQQKLSNEMAQHNAELTKTALTTANEVALQKLKASEEPEKKEAE